jgi:hypothetical protein
MASADDDFDDEEDASEEPSCPFCGAVDGDCGHLLACIDWTDGRIVGGGTFFDRRKRAFEVMNQAVMGLLRALKKRGQDLELQTKPHDPRFNEATLYRLRVLVREVQEAIGKSLEEEEEGEEEGEDMGSCTGAFFQYLDDLFEEMPGVVETDQDWVGGPGWLSLIKVYWSESAEQAAADALRQIEQDADCLRCLT